MDSPTPLQDYHAARSLRQVVEAVAAEVEADQRRHRTRKRVRGDCSKAFLCDFDRFAVAAMVAAQLARDDAAVNFGARRSPWSAAQHAAAVFSPGRGQNVSFRHRHAGDVILACAVFNAPERHEPAARRLVRKHRALEGLPATWTALSGALLAQLNAPGRSGARAHARALLGRLGWLEVPPDIWMRLWQFLALEELNGATDLLDNDRR